MHQQDGRAQRKKTPDRNITIIRWRLKGSDNRKEDTNHQDRKYVLIGEADELTGLAGV